MEKNSYDILIEKLDAFIRKYYKNQLIKGVLYSISSLLIFYLIVITLEYYNHFESAVRTVLFYSFVLVTASILGKLVVIPFLKLRRLGKIISHEQAAQIIGQHFEGVQDKLLNTLQLKKQAQGAGQMELIEASIRQKAAELKPVPFGSAIDLGQNKKYLKYALPPIAVMLLLLFVKADIITDGTNRIVNHADYFEIEAPFSFVVQNDALEVVEQEDYELQIKLEGDAFPENAYIEINGNQFKLNKENNVTFSYLFKNVQESTEFNLYAEGFYSKNYELKTLPNPILLNFEVALDYPAYIGKADERIKNSGDLVIPAGTRVQWALNTKHTNVLRMSFSDSTYTLDPRTPDYYQFSKRFVKSRSYSIAAVNEYLTGRDSILYHVNVIPDLYPSIDVEEKQDSNSTKRLYFKGDVKDDYGFKRLVFHYRKLQEGNSGPGNELKSVNIPINLSVNQDQFFHFWDLNELEIAAGDQVEYYFEIWDNDGVTGSKSARTPTKLFKAPTLQELSEKTDEKSQEIKDDLTESIKEAKQLREELDAMQKEMLDKKTMSWQEKNKIQNLLDRQKELQKKVENIQEKNKEKNMEQQEYRQMDESIMEKQEQLEKLFEEVMTEEMKKMMEEMEKLLQQLDKNQVQEELEDMELGTKDLEKELDRMLEIYKQLEFEQKLEETKNKLEELAEEQEELSEDTKEKSEDNEQLSEEQEELNEKFEDIKKDLDDLKEKNEELEQPNNMEDTEPQEQEIQEDMEKSSEQLEKNKNKKASESQKGASEKMQKMAEQMDAMMQGMQAQNQQEDMDALRALLENLIQMSFDQEELMDNLKKVNAKDPKYVALAQEQRKLKDNARVIEDSLFALSKRVMQLESIINREISSINQNMAKAIDEMGERRSATAASRQQLVMTSTNNLALLLDEALQQMQKQMASSMPGTGQCEKPGGSGQGKPSPASMKQMQQQLAQQLEQLKKELEKGPNPGGKKPGDQKGEGMAPGGKGEGGKMPGMSKKLAKLAAQQEAIRKMLDQYGQELNKDGSGAGNELNDIKKKMEETEKDLVNKNITRETITRQQDILTRLLEAEKAEREREYDNKRESKEGKNDQFSNPSEYFEYKRQKEKEVELLKTVPPSLKTYYKNKVNQYFNTIEE